MYFLFKIYQFAYLVQNVLKSIHIYYFIKWILTMDVNIYFGANILP